MHEQLERRIVAMTARCAVAFATLVLVSLSADLVAAQTGQSPNAPSHSQMDERRHVPGRFNLDIAGSNEGWVRSTEPAASPQEGDQIVPNEQARRVISDAEQRLRVQNHISVVAPSRRPSSSATRR